MINVVTEALSAYILHLDWGYIFTFMFLAHFMVQDKMVAGLPFKIKETLKMVSVAWRVIILGIIYGLFVYYIRGYKGKEGVEIIIQSLTFAVVFHKLVLDAILKSYLKKTDED
jgi:hypothetical protein